MHKWYARKRNRTIGERKDIQRLIEKICNSILYIEKIRRYPRKPDAELLTQDQELQVLHCFEG